MDKRNVIESPKSQHLISVIVPVYKVEAYLRQCIDSILAQTFTDFELILIDDGSPDNCGAICDEYAAKDERIVVIHQENGGLSAARNAGLDWVFANSDSEWVTFVDSDDCVASTFLQYLYKYAEEACADIVTTNGHYSSTAVEMAQIPDHIVSYQELRGKIACEGLYTGSQLLNVCAWGKLYKKKLLQSLRFPVGKIHEDNDFVPKALFLADKVVALRAWLYGYRQVQGSIMNKRFYPKRFDAIDAINSCVQFYQLNGDERIAQLAENYRNVVWAEYSIKARRNKIYRGLPEQYKLPLWKVFWILFWDTIRRGGVIFVFQRIDNLRRQLFKR